MKMSVTCCHCGQPNELSVTVEKKVARRPPVTTPTAPPPWAIRPVKAWAERLEAGAWSNADLLEDYTEWAAQNGAPPLESRQLSVLLRELGYERWRTADVRGFDIAAARQQKIAEAWAKRSGVPLTATIEPVQTAQEV